MADSDGVIWDKENWDKISWSMAEVKKNGTS